MNPAMGADKSIRITNLATFSVSLVLLWAIGAAVLWWAYSMSAFIKGGAYDKVSATRWVAEFSCILSAIVAAVWLINRSRTLPLQLNRVIWRVLWQTAILLFLYAAVIVIRRQTWSGDVNDWAMFFGNLNAQFFSEDGPFSFVLLVLPVISLTSAGLFSLQVLIERAARP